MLIGDLSCNSAIPGCDDYLESCMIRALLSLSVWFLKDTDPPGGAKVITIADIRISTAKGIYTQKDYTLCTSHTPTHAYQQNTNPNPSRCSLLRSLRRYSPLSPPHLVCSNHQIPQAAGYFMP